MTWSFSFLFSFFSQGGHIQASQLHRAIWIVAIPFGYSEYRLDIDYLWTLYSLFPDWSELNCDSPNHNFDSPNGICTPRNQEFTLCPAGITTCIEDLFHWLLCSNRSQSSIKKWHGRFFFSFSPRKNLSVSSLPGMCSPVNYSPPLSARSKCSID